VVALSLTFALHSVQRMSAISFSFRAQRQRSPDGAPCATYGATPCWHLND
jgi:hypothetical protein